MDEIRSLLPWLDIAGLAVFAVSGALIAVRKRVDLIGVCFFALVTAVGGGTLRDLLIDAPVFWMHDSMPIVLSVVIAVTAWLVPLRWWPERAFEWFDAAGLAAYSVYGSNKAMLFGVSPVSAVAAGVITACLGGVIRDVTIGVPSILMRQELYVTTSLVGAGLFVGLDQLGLPAPWPAALGVLAGFSLRGAAIHWKLRLPAHRGS